jgi:hypothetical protein
MKTQTTLLLVGAVLIMLALPSDGWQHDHHESAVLQRTRDTNLPAISYAIAFPKGLHATPATSSTTRPADRAALRECSGGRPLPSPSSRIGQNRMQHFAFTRTLNQAYNPARDTAQWRVT